MFLLTTRPMHWPIKHQEHIPCSYGRVYCEDRACVWLPRGRAMCGLEKAQLGGMQAEKVSCQNQQHNMPSQCIRVMVTNGIRKQQWEHFSPCPSITQESHHEDVLHLSCGPSADSISSSPEASRRFPLRSIAFNLLCSQGLRGPTDLLSLSNPSPPLCMSRLDVGTPQPLI